MNDSELRLLMSRLSKKGGIGVASLRKLGLRVEFVSGTVGGQNVNKTRNGVRLSYKSLQVQAIERDRHLSLRVARKRLVELAGQELDDRIAAAKKEKWRNKKNETIRTYNLTNGTVKDHRTGRRSTVKRILTKGHLEDLRDF